MTREVSLRAELLDLLPIGGQRFGLTRREVEHLVWLVQRTRVLD